MRKMLWFALMLSVLFATQVTPTYACTYKDAQLISTGDGDMIVETGENVVWKMTIAIHNDGSLGTWTDVVVTDRLGGELEVDSIGGMSQGTVSYYTTGKTEKVHLTWYIGTLAPGEAWLWFYVSTDINPGGNQEYTTPGTYWLNTGPTVKYRVDGVQYSFEIPPIMITVLPQS